MKNMVLSLILTQLILLPLAHKWELDLNKVIVGGLGVGLLTGLLSNLIAFFYPLGVHLGFLLIVGLVIVISCVALLFWFYRDSDRLPPERKNVIISPADGTIKYIKRISAGSVPLSSKGKEHVPLGPPLLDVLPKREGYLVGIAMTFLDVHVTRAPIEGKMTFSDHINGSFLSLKRADAPYRNERVVQIIRNGKISIGLIHIASRLVRRIESYIKTGDQLKLGQKIGMIKLGSQVDIIVPDQENLCIDVNVGDRVFAGITIIARI